MNAALDMSIFSSVCLSVYLSVLDTHVLWHNG